MDAQLAEKLGQVARVARLRAGLTQAEVAERLGIVSEVYGRLERGLMLPSVETLKKLSWVLAISSDELLGLREPAPLALAPPAPGNGQSPELRRLLRRVGQLDRRKLRLLTLLAAGLTRNE